MRLHNTDKSLVCFTFCGEVILRIRKSIIQMQKVNVACYGPTRNIAAIWRTQPRILQHLLVESKVASVEYSAHPTLKQEHHSARTVISIHEHD